MIFQNFRFTQRQADGVSPLARKFTFHISATGLIGTIVVALLGIAWVFAFGVIVGRGYNPIQAMPGLGRLAAQMPAPEEQDTTGIIKLEDLTFYDDLKSKPLLSSEQGPSTTAQTTSGLGGQANQNVQSGMQPEEKKPVIESEEERYTFVYQVIAYKKADQAETFRKQLKGAGLNTRLETEKNSRGKVKMYKVQVVVKGTEEDADKACAILEENGIDEPFLLSQKKIVTRKGKKK